MKIFVETERLILRELLPIDDVGMFEMDSDPEVHRYVGNNPVTHIDQIRNVIQNVRQQYIDNGIGRWAIIEKTEGNFVGWAGLKLIKEETNGYATYYDLGYRLARKYWGIGYATESAIAARDYGFNKLHLSEINGRTHPENSASGNVLVKTGLKFVNRFTHTDGESNWYSITREDWANMR